MTHGRVHEIVCRADHEVLGEKLASTLLKHIHDSLLLTESLIAEFFYDRVNLRLNQLENAWLHLCKKLMSDLVRIGLLGHS